MTSVASSSTAVAPADATPTTNNKSKPKPIPKPGFSKNLVQQRELLYGMLYLECYFCGEFRTPIVIDMELHIYERHRKKLFESLPVRGKGMTLERRLLYVVYQMRISGRLHKQVFGPECFE